MSLIYYSCLTGRLHLAGRTIFERAEKG